MNNKRFLICGCKGTHFFWFQQIFSRKSFPKVKKNAFLFCFVPIFMYLCIVIL
nr:MAG TPA: hypothetical protein [Caudoviricetes sp.]